MSSSSRSIPGELLSRFDPGWFFLISGLAVIVWVVLIPAQEELEAAQWRRDHVRAEEVYRGQQLAQYANFLQALDHADPKLVRWLAASQLNMAIGEVEVMPASLSDDPENASVFGVLDPVFEPPTRPEKRSSLLHQMATSDRTRLWVFLGAGLCIFYGLLPPATGRSRGR